MPNLVDVDERVPRGELLDGGLLVGEAVVAEVEVAEAVVRLGPGRRPAAVADLDDDEADLRELLLAGRGREGVRRPFLLRAGVDVDDDRVLLRRVEVERLPHVAVEVGHAVGGLDDEGLGELPARLGQPGQVGLLQLHHLVAVGGADDGRGGQVDPRDVVDDELAGRREDRSVVGRARVQEGQAGPVEVHAVEVLVVDVLLRLAGVGGEVEEPVIGVDLDDVRRAVGARRDGVLELAVAVVQVEVAPAGPLRPPDHLAGLVEVARRLELQGRVLEPLADETLRRPGRHVHRAEFEVPDQAVAADEPEVVGGLAPVEVGVGLVLPLRLDPGEGLLLDAVDVQLLACGRPPRRASRTCTFRASVAGSSAS